MAFQALQQNRNKALHSDCLVPNDGHLGGALEWRNNGIPIYFDRLWTWYRFDAALTLPCLQVLRCLQECPRQRRLKCHHHQQGHLAIRSRLPP